MRRIIIGLFVVLAALLSVGCAAGGSGMNVANPSLESEDAAAPVLSWHREGGFAGFCDDVLLFADGRGQIRSCRPPETTRDIALTPEQMRQLEDWMASYRAFTHESSDDAVADGMTIIIGFVGQGTDAETTAVIEAMGRLAEQLLRAGS